MESQLSPPVHPARLPIEELLRDCSIKRTRASGPGGQHRNKVETAVVICHGPTGVVGQASEKRSQLKNREVAIERLRVNLALATRTELRIEEINEPSNLWASRVKASKIQVNPRHTDFPALLAEALDFVALWEFDVSKAAGHLGVSSSQLVKFLKNCPAAFELVNRGRKDRGLKNFS